MTTGMHVLHAVGSICCSHCEEHGLSTALCCLDAAHGRFGVIICALLKTYLKGKTVQTCEFLSFWVNKPGGRFTKCLSTHRCQQYQVGPRMLNNIPDQIEPPRQATDSNHHAHLSRSKSGNRRKIKIRHHMQAGQRKAAEPVGPCKLLRFSCPFSHAPQKSEWSCVSRIWLGQAEDALESSVRTPRGHESKAVRGQTVSKCGQACNMRM